MQAVAASSTAMQAVAASSTAMQAVAASSTAISAMAASDTAKKALQSSNLVKKYSKTSAGWTSNPTTAYSGSGLLLKVSFNDNSGGWSIPGNNNQKVLLDGVGFTATNGHSTDPCYQTASKCVIDESVRRFEKSIGVYLYNKFELLYIPC